MRPGWGDRGLLLLTMLAGGSPAGATMYQCVDASGAMVYTDSAAQLRNCTVLNLGMASGPSPARPSAPMNEPVMPEPAVPLPPEYPVSAPEGMMSAEAPVPVAPPPAAQPCSPAVNPFNPFAGPPCPPPGGQEVPPAVPQPGAFPAPPTQ
jgi:hypothetical protein